MTPFFSIIIPTLNEEKYLPKLLNCLLKQSYSQFEVLVVDGASNDRTISKVEKYISKFDKRKQHCSVHLVKKRNVSYQRNYGAARARGTYLVFFDADVMIKSDFLLKIHAHIKKKGLLLVTTKLAPDSNETFDDIWVLCANIGIELSSHGPKPFLPGHNIVVERKSFVSVGRFDEKIKHAEDHHFALSAYKKGVRLNVINDTVQYVSMRRIRSDGRIGVFRKYVKSLAHQIFIGPIRENIFDYPMGGEYHASTKYEPMAKRIKKRIPVNIKKHFMQKS